MLHLLMYATNLSSEARRRQPSIFEFFTHQFVIFALVLLTPYAG
jgi:hypothetical protein